MRRREFIGTGAGVLGATALAGCTGAFETRPVRSTPPVLEDRPDAVYVPTHVEGMAMVGTGRAGRYGVALTYSYPHRFWLVTGQRRERVEVSDEDSLHLMATVWDRESGVVPPNATLGLAIARDGESVTTRSMWPMLSQNMGVHLGDNVALPGGGSYTLEATVGPASVRHTGAFEGAFEAPASATVSFDFDPASLDDVSFERLDDRAGERSALDPMRMGDVPVARAPAKADLPGRVVGEATSGDGVFVVTVLSDPPAGVSGERYLAVSARTPYNRYPLPAMSLRATVARDGETTFEGDCRETLDPDLGHHYGAVIDAIDAGDDLTLSVGAPPQVARHEGYETAFFEMPEMRLTV